jgi:hypothetical protein
MKAWAAGCLACLLSVPASAHSSSGWIADAAASPWLYESGKSRYHSFDAWHGGFELRSGRNAYRDQAIIRRGHLPPRGKCLAWFLSRLPGC